jgi:hypothetical protein
MPPDRFAYEVFKEQDTAAKLYPTVPGRMPQYSGLGNLKEYCYIL